MILANVAHNVMCVAMCSVGEECTQEVADLLERCIRTNVDERPTAKEIVAALQVRFCLSQRQTYTVHIAWYLCCRLVQRNASVVNPVRGHEGKS